MDDLIKEFLVETSESMGELDNQLIALEADPENEQLIASIFRLLHTIKGTCGFLGLSRLEHIAHAGEDVLGKYRDKSLKVTPEGVSLILEAFDAIKGIMSHLEEHGSEPDGDDTSLTSRLWAFIGVSGHANANHFEAVLTDLSSNLEEAEAPPVEEAPKTDKKKGKKKATPAIAAETEEVETTLEATAPTPEPAPPPPAIEAKPKPAAAEHGKEDTSNQTIRVSLDVLEQLMQTISELVLTRNQLNQIARTRQDQDFVGPIQRLSHITTELQDGIMKTRMQPIGNAWSKLPRLVRDTAKELGKQIDLVMLGEETELDRQLLEVIRDPLEHFRFS